MAASVRLFTIIIVNYCICSSMAMRNYDLLLTDIKCKSNPTYASKPSCELYGDRPSTGVNFDMQMHKFVKNYRLDLIFFLNRKSKYVMLLFKAPNLDVCEVFHGNITVPLVQMLKDMTLKAGKWPKCPVPVNFHYQFRNLTPDLDYFPSSLPEVGFKFTVIKKDGKKIVGEIDVFGKVVHKKSSQGYQIEGR